jgi:2-oxo-4-hydroxy-4-carboxy--5-ureidoimidazoline (OHCU) decarboxylase
VYSVSTAFLTEIEELNTEYEARHGLKFVVFVNGRSRAEIVDVLRERIGNETELEMRNGLEAMVDIARV